MEVWLINLPGEAFNHFYSNDTEGLGLTGVQEVFLTSFEDMKIQSRIIVEGTDRTKDTQITMEYFPVTRSERRARNQLQVAQESGESSAVSHDQMQEAQGISAIHTPAGDNCISSSATRKRDNQVD